MTNELDSDALDAELRRIDGLPTEEQIVALAKVVEALEDQLR